MSRKVDLLAGHISKLQRDALVDAEIKTLQMELESAKAHMRFLNERIDMLENRFEVVEENERCRSDSDGGAER